MKKTIYAVLTILLCFIFVGTVRAAEKPATPVLVQEEGISRYELSVYSFNVYIETDQYNLSNDPDNPEFTIDGMDLYYVTGTCMNNNTCEAVLDGGYYPDEYPDISIPVGTSQTFVARVYVLDEGDNKVYSDYSNQLTITAPELSAPVLSDLYNGPTAYANGVYTYYMGINSVDYMFPNTEDDPVYMVDGFQLCSVETNQCNDFSMGDEIDFDLEVNETATFYERVYDVDESETRTYSEKSANLTISAVLDAPTLANRYVDDPASNYDKPFTAYSNAYFTYHVGINDADYIMSNTESNPVYIADGYVLCDSTNQCTDHNFGDDVDLDVKANQALTYYAKVYVAGEGETRYYSEKSANLTLGVTLEAPTFNTTGDTVQYSGGKYVYTKSINVDNYKYLRSSNSQVEYFINGYEVCEKNTTTCTNYNVNQNFTVSLNSGETKTYVARVYVQDSENNRVYSENSRDLTIENKSLPIADIIEAFNNGELTTGFHTEENNLRAVLENNKIVIRYNDKNGEDSVLIEYNVNEDSISYRDAEEFTVDRIGEDFISNLLIGQLALAVFNVAGYENFDVSEDLDLGADDAFERYGLYMKEAEYAFSGEDEGVSYDFRGTYLKEFKISTNKAVLDAFYKTYAKPLSTTIDEKPNLEVRKGNNNSLELTWDGNSYADGYKIYRSESKKGKYKNIATVTDPTYVDKKLTYGKTYYYKVKAYNSESSKTSDIVSKKVTPNKVENVVAKTSGSTKVKLSWDKVSVTGYEIYRSTDQKKWTKVTTITKSKTVNYTNKKLKSNKKYYYKIRAYKTVNRKKVYGKYSSVIEIRTAPAVPKLSISNSEVDSLKVKVTGVKGAIEYYVYRGTSKKGTYIEVNRLDAEGSFVDHDLKTGKTYYYKVKGCNAEGRCGSYTSLASKKVIPGKPKFTAEVENKVVTLSVENMRDLDGYEVSRSTSKTSGFKVVKTVSGTDDYTGKLSKGTYYYRVRTYRLVSGKKVYSKNSAVNKVVVK